MTIKIIYELAGGSSYCPYCQSIISYGTVCEHGVFGDGILAVNDNSGE
jgi:hypothetical protein